MMEARLAKVRQRKLKQLPTEEGEIENEGEEEGDKEGEAGKERLADVMPPGDSSSQGKVNLPHPVTFGRLRSSHELHTSIFP